MPGLQAIVFDLDDTLYPEEQYVLSGFRAVSDWGGEHLHVPAEQGFRELEELFRSGAHGDTFDRWLDSHGLSSDGAVSELVRIYRAHEPDISPFPEAEPLLQRLSSRYRLALLSDGYADVQNAKLDALGLRPRFEAVVITDELGADAWKPSPRGFAEVLAQLRVRADAAAYVSDNPAKDFLGARRAGLRSIRIRRPGGLYGRLEPETPEHAPDLETDGLDGVEAMLSALEGRA